MQACLQSVPADRPLLSAVVLLMQDSLDGDARWEIGRSGLTAIRNLGEGQFGEVVLYLLQGDNEVHESALVACKMLKVPEAALDTDAAAAAAAETEFFQELNLMKRLRHPNLVMLRGAVTTSSPFMIVLEFLAGGSLEDWLTRNADQVPDRTLTGILHQVALGMVALGQHGVVHRDLAARNVLVGEDSIVKVSDYGLSREISDTNYYTLRTGRALPIRWTAPEVLLTVRWNVMTDVYSYGVLVAETFTRGEIPYDQHEDPEFLELLGGDESLFDHLSFAWRGRDPPTGMKALAGRCVSREPSERPSFAAVAQSCWELAAASATAVDGAVDDGYLMIQSSDLPPVVDDFVGGSESTVAGVFGGTGGEAMA